jgi:hypothetical protein
MLHRATLSVLLVVASLFASAQGWKQVDGKGEVVRKALTVPAFHGIEVEGSMDVVITPASVQSVEVEGQENLVALVTTEVRNGVWVIGTSSGYGTNKPFVVHLRVPVIDVVEVNGSGDVKADGAFTAGAVQLAVNGSGDLDLAFTASNVDVRVQGSGDVKVSGSCTELRAAVVGSGDINARDLKAESVQASVSGSGDIVVHATKRLNAAISGSGDVVYAGDPMTVDKRIDGSGEVRALRTSGKL